MIRPQVEPSKTTTTFNHRLGPTPAEIEPLLVWLAAGKRFGRRLDRAQDFLLVRGQLGMSSDDVLPAMLGEQNLAPAGILHAPRQSHPAGA